MKRRLFYIICLLMTAVLLCSSILATDKPYYLCEITSSRIKTLAYSDLSSDNESLNKEILKAREIIIYSTSWVADGLSGYILDKSGNVIETLPHFSEVFPADWDVPTVLPYDQPNTKIPHFRIRTISQVDLPFNDSVWLYYPPSSATSSPFCSFQTSGFIGTPYAFHYSKVTTQGIYGDTTQTAYYNIGYSNANTGVNLGWKVNLSNGNTFSITPPHNITMAVRASTYSNVGSWWMRVSAIR